MADSISNLLTVIRNASRAGIENASVPHSKLVASVAGILRDEGLLREVTETTDARGHKRLQIRLKYVNDVPAITGIERVSRPGRRVYHPYGEIPRVLGGLGFSILTTSRGVLRDREARRHKVGGEVLCKVW